MEERSRNYDELIQNLQLETLFILDSHVKREEYFNLPADIKIEKEHRFENDKDKIKAYIQYSLKATEKGKEEPGFSIFIKYLVVYKSKVKMTNDFFSKFAKTSLIIETWPYFRHYVNETTMNMGLPPLLLNVLPFLRKKKTTKK